MRITAGKLKGREVRLPKGSRARPATSQLRETLMNLVGPGLAEGGAFVDLCAGSGIVGLEALSRGAQLAVFVEVDGRTVAGLKQTLREFGVAGQARIIRGDVRRSLARVGRVLEGRLAAVVFLDPPFIPQMAGDLLSYVAQEPGLLASGGVVVVRTPDRLPAEVGAFTLRERRGKGTAQLYLYGAGQAG